MPTRIRYFSKPEVRWKPSTSRNDSSGTAQVSTNLNTSAAVSRGITIGSPSIEAISSSPVREFMPSRPFWITARPMAPRVRKI